MTHLTIDIETMPREFTESELQRVNHLNGMETVADFLSEFDVKTGNIKDPVKIEQKVLETGSKMRDDAVQKIIDTVNKTGLDRNQLTIAVIGYKIDGQPAETISNPCFTDDSISRDDGEKIMLQQFVDAVQLQFVHCYITHNGNGFDLPAIWRRGIKYGIADIVRFIPHEKFGKNVDDVMSMWAATDYRDMTGLKKIAQFLSIDRGNDLDGSMVSEYIRNGRIDDVAEYCVSDVELTAQIWERITMKTLDVDNGRCPL